MAVRTYSPQTTEALTVMGQMIVLKRKEAKLTAQALADKAGVSRSTIHRIERGDPKCEIGVAFELVTLLGADIFDIERHLITQGAFLAAKIKALPKTVRTSQKAVDNDF